MKIYITQSVMDGFWKWGVAKTDNEKVISWSGMFTSKRTAKQAGITQALSIGKSYGLKKKDIEVIEIKSNLKAPFPSAKDSG